ncbi:hypothetical protein OIV83_006226 [Microbotryomycetes sp. JL201]|nr:hypothetical protein OIV83_006226 [Microbotryomycetes sp. JL201]
MALQSKADALRAELNLKNLRRHDASIEQILSTASYVTVYRNHGEGWVKTGIEGPMFLFERSQLPRHGFFVLNRQGLEYVQEYLTADSDVKIEGEFLLYEPGEQADRATGLWIAEEKDRTELCRRMVDICNDVKRAAVVAKSSQMSTGPKPTSKAISLNDLFGSAANPARMSPTITSPSQPSALPSTRVPALDMLFSSAASPPPPAPASRPPPPTLPPLSNAPKPTTGTSLLDEMFKAAAQPKLSPQPTSQPTPHSPPPKDAHALLAMLGHPSSNSPIPNQLTPKLSEPQTLSQALCVGNPMPAPAAASRAQAMPLATQTVLPSSQTKAPPPQPRAVSPAASTKPLPKFAPPLLSHDVFDMLPLPAGARTGSPSASRSPLAQTQPLPQPAISQPAVSQPAVSQRPGAEPRTNGASTSTSAIQNEASSNGQTREPKALSKSNLLAVLDELVTTEKLGMDKVEQGVIVGQKEFINKVQEMVKKPAFATALYARYLERCDDEDDD